MSSVMAGFTLTMAALGCMLVFRGNPPVSQHSVDRPSSYSEQHEQHPRDSIKGSYSPKK